MAANTSPCPRCGTPIYLTDDQCLSCGARLDAGRLVEAAAIGMGLVGILLASIFTAYLNTAYYTCLYLWAAATETAEAAVPAPAPLAAVAW